jgi:hypothetical protein
MSATGGDFQTFDAEPDAVEALCAAIRALAENLDDPRVLIGALIEGAVYTADRSIPPAQQAATAASMLRLLADRLDAYGLGQASQRCSVKFC